jgi:arylsulfatase A-like enzyme
VLVTAVVAGAISTTPHRQPTARAGEPRRPDVVLIITDDQRAGTLSNMPQLRRRVIRRGILFRSAYAPNSTCCPSRVSIYTGTYSHTNGVWGNAGPFGGFLAYDDSSNLATWLNGIGYRTGLFGKYLNGYDDLSFVPRGWDEWFGFSSGDGRTYYGFEASENGRAVDFPDDVYSTAETYKRVADFIRSTPESRPLFAVWTPVAPHRPFVPEDRYAETRIDVSPWRPPNYNERDVSDKPKWVRRLDRLAGRDRKAIDAERIAQYRTLLSVDDGVGRIVRALKRTGRLPRTLLVFISDNGLMWGEHRLRKKAVPYDGASKVPMIVRYDPLIRGPRRGSDVASSVLHIDLAPTVMDIVGATPGSPVDGRSLRPLLNGSLSSVRTRFVIEHHGGRVPAYCGARTPTELFVRYSTGEEEYYRLDEDPWNLHNLAGTGGWGAEIRELRDYARNQCDPVPPDFSW